ncbi:MAG: DnaJ domain-containing protein [Candidatus Undinarchaeales archaeon]|jgi:hypothetical protein|nr:DnaJ domain-containing protein [Candidatus Undinarchaeales archaeon]MDP7493426.1 DnaJ domain-containing protein [Candidatus Undinarchaeales archaeon]
MAYEFTNLTDAYQALGVKSGAGEKDVKDAYRSLAMQHHPDRGGDANIFDVITKARDYINDNGYGAGPGVEKLIEGEKGGNIVPYQAPTPSYGARGAHIDELERGLAEQRYDAAGTNPYADNPQETAERSAKLGKYWEGAKEFGKGALDLGGRAVKGAGNAIESGIGYVGATYKKDSASRAHDLYETSKTLGEARDVYYQGILKNKAQMQSTINQIEEITPSTMELMFDWL